MADLRTRSIQGATLDARADRLVNQILTAGILRGGSDDFRVVPQSTPNMTVRVGSGTAGDIAVVAGSRQQGVFLVENREPYYGGGTAEVPIANGDPSNPRIDGIDLVVLDDEADSSGESVARIVVTEGTPAATPAAPAVPAAALRLATVSVPAGESSAISSGAITDLRSAARVQSATVKRFTAVASNGPTSGTAELTMSTVNVPAQPFPVELDVAAFLTGVNSAALDVFAARIKVNGVERAGITVRFPDGVNRRELFVIPTIEPVVIPAGTPATVTFTIAREGATGGTLSTVTGGRMTVTATPHT